MADNGGKYKVLKSKVAVAKGNCTKALAKLEQTLDSYNKNRGNDVPVTRRRRIAAELCEHVELSKNKLQDLSSLVDSLIIVIQELEDDQFNNPNKKQ